MVAQEEKSSVRTEIEEHSRTNAMLRDELFSAERESERERRKETRHLYTEHAAALQQRDVMHEAQAAKLLSAVADQARAMVTLREELVRSEKDARERMQRMEMEHDELLESALATQACALKAEADRRHTVATTTLLQQRDEEHAAAIEEHAEWHAALQQQSEIRRKFRAVVFMV
jgi:hypothetical protein